MLKHTDIEAVCELCRASTGIVVKLGDLAEKIPDFDIGSETKYPMGLCAKCKSDLESGCTVFVDITGRAIKVSAEATKDKIQAEYHGKIVRIPVSALDILLDVYNKTNGKPSST